MDELEELLGNLGKDVGGGASSTVLGDDDRVMSRIKERRISRRMATKTGGELQPKNQIQTSHLSVQTSAARPTSGLEDLGDLMSELGVGPPLSNQRASGATQSISRLSTKPAPQAAAPVSAQPKPAGFHDEIDNLMAALSLTPQSQPQPRQQPQPVRQSVPPQQVKAPLDDPLLGDINALMESLGPIQTSPAPSYQAPKPQHYAPPQQMSNPHPVHPTGPAADADLDALISSLNPDPLVATAPARSPQPTAGRVNSPQDLSNLFRTQMTDMNTGAPAAKGICATCKRPIHAQMMQALGKAYHVDCFVCGNCGDSLGTSSFYQSGDGTPNCRKCHEALFCARCAHCDQAIQGNCITAIGKKWHVNCFICAQCLRPFGTNLVYEKEGNPFCESCFYGIFSSRCAGCDQPIKADCINACGKQWHVEHFVCTYCKKAFGAEPYFEHAGLPYCKLHYHQQQGSLCGCGCGRPVMGRVVQALGKQWLPEHFICGYCMNGLAGQTFTERDGKAYCSVCYGKLFS